MKVRAKLREGLTSYKSPKLHDGSTLTVSRDDTFVLVDEQDWYIVSSYLELLTEAFEVLEKDVLNIWVRDGIGDIFWVLMKLEHLKEACEAEKMHLWVRDISPLRPNRAHQFLELVEMVDSWSYIRDDVPISPLGVVVKPDGRDYDYAFDANKVLEEGLPLRYFLPNMEERLPKLKGEPPKKMDLAVVYFGDSLAEKIWGADHDDKRWAYLVRYLASRVEKVVAVGLQCDAEKAYRVEKADCDFTNLVGKTTFKQAFDLMRAARLTIGSVSGLSVVAAAYGARCIILWPGQQSQHYLPSSMQTAGIDNMYYKAIEYGTDVEKIKRAAEILMRK